MISNESDVLGLDICHFPFQLLTSLHHWVASRPWWISTPFLPTPLTSRYPWITSSQDSIVICVCLTSQICWRAPLTNIISVRKMWKCTFHFFLFSWKKSPKDILRKIFFPRIFWGSLLRNFFQSGKTFSALARQHNVLAHRFVNFL